MPRATHPDQLDHATAEEHALAHFISEFDAKCQAIIRGFREALEAREMGGAGI